MLQQSKRRLSWHGIAAAFAAVLAVLAGACANIGSPDGGPYDETPPHIVATSPREGAVNSRARRITLLFNENIQVSNATEKLVISPPQIEQAEIKSSGRRISISLKDSLKPSTTYTLDFGDAIIDNTEGNPMGQYAFVFSTGDRIDTLQMSGTVLEAKNLEPVKGILVGVHSDLSDSAFLSRPLDRVARTDGSGRFTIKGIAPGRYRVYALEDADGDFRFSQKSEKIAFDHTIQVPSCGPATRQDTSWVDSTHYDTIVQVVYTRFVPDDIILRAFDETYNLRHLLKAERKEATHFTLYFTGTSPHPPVIRGLNFDADSAFVVNSTQGNDTVTYWLARPELVRQDTLELSVTYDDSNDSTYLTSERTDTLELVARTPYSRVEKQEQDDLEKWQKQRDRALKRGTRFSTPRPRTWLKMRYSAARSISPAENFTLSVGEPLARIDTARIRLLLQIDSTYHPRPYLFLPGENDRLRYTLYGEWRPGQHYKLQIDTAALASIYGHVNAPLNLEFDVPAAESYASLFVNVQGADSGHVIVQLLSNGDRVLREAGVAEGHADFFFLRPGTYYLRCFVDQNGNGLWDTGLYSANRQPEPLYYYPAPVVLKANWDVEQDWNVQALPLNRQKPERITKQKPDRERTIQHRNAERERKKNKR